MLNRILVHILIITIIACPLCCSFGLCHSADSCCANTEAQVVSASEDCISTNETPNCCGCCATSPVVIQGAATVSTSSNSEPPCRDESCRDTCQGICGGALAARDNDLQPELLVVPRGVSGWGDVVLIRVSPNDIQTSSWLISPSLADQGMSPGRFVRVLHSSWLC